jgi:hypothetical protein
MLKEVSDVSLLMSDCKAGDYSQSGEAVSVGLSEVETLEGSYDVANKCTVMKYVQVGAFLASKSVRLRKKVSLSN